MDEQLIMEVTGHRSLAVHNYKCVSDTKHEKVNDVIQGTSSDTARSVEAVTTTTSSFESDGSDRKVSFTINQNLIKHILMLVFHGDYQLLF